MIKVTLVRRKSRSSTHPNRTHLYLNYSPAIFNPVTMKTVRVEALNMTIYDNPKTTIENKYNKEMIEKAEAIRCQRQVMVINEEYGFLDKTTRKADFLEFYKNIVIRKGYKQYSSYLHFSRFVHGECRFGNISVQLCERFREYLLNDAKGPRGDRICNNTAAAYYCHFRSVLKEAYKAKLLRENINDYLDKIPETKVERPYLTMDEVKMLNYTPCHIPVMKNAAMFAILTGLRISDIVTLDWEHITVAPDGEPCIMKMIQKSKRIEMIPISDEALAYCGERGKGLVFKGFSKVLAYNHLSKWIGEAGIKKHVSFHIFRHTHATLLLANGTDIYTVSKMLTHQNVGTTQIYAEVVDPLKRMAANAITLK